MDQDKLIHSLRLQIRLYQGIIALIVLTSLGWWGIGSFGARPYAILADGKPIVNVATEKEANSVLDQVRKSIPNIKPSDVDFTQDVEIGRGDRHGEVLSVADAAKAVKGNVSIRLKKTAIVVSGVPVVAVDSKEVAQEVLDTAKQKFGTLAKNLMEEPAFKEECDVQVRDVDPEIYQSTVEGALDMLLSGSGGSGSGTYVVASGDVAGSIASRLHMTMEQLRQLNSGRNLDKLQIGDHLKVAQSSGKARPHITVVVRDKSSRREAIPYNTENVSSMQMFEGKQSELSPGRNGLRDVVVAETYENGVKTGSEVVEENIIRNPVPRRVAVGIRKKG